MVAALALLAAGSLAAAGPGKEGAKDMANDLPVIRERMLAPYRTPPEAKLVAKWREALGPDGSWPDVNYAGKSTIRWEPVEHLRRLQALTHAWFAPATPTCHDEKLLAEIGRALDCWLAKDLKGSWWWNQIGALKILAPILLMLDEKLAPAQRAKALAVLARAVPDKTGQNLVWEAEMVAWRAVLQQDAKLLRGAFAAIHAELRVGDGEGLQADFSFHQHGPCLYNHGYGAGFATDNARLAALTAGTAYAYPPEKIALLSAYLLDGSQWLALGPHPDFGALGRQIVRPRQTAAYLGEAAQFMLSVPTGREREFRDLAARIAGEDTPPLTGNKHFFRSDIMVHHRPGWYLSARMYSTRTLNTDGLSGCDEGQLSHYLSEGATCIMIHGHEYSDLFPVWDWQRIPGTTVELAPHRPGDPKRKGETAFAGGASDGACGVAAFHLQRGALRARKGWFCFSDVAVCLGSDLLCATDHPVVTTINQCRLRGPVTVGRDGSSEAVKEGERTLTARWVWHDGLGYLFGRETNVALANRERAGNWKRISAQRPADPVKDQVFTLGLEHGARPAGTEYAYAVMPVPRPEAMPALARKPPCQILANSARVQAVFHPGDAVLGVVFHKAGELAWEEWRIKVDRPCVIVARNAPDQRQLAVADPAAGAGAVKLEITWPDRRQNQLEVALPQGQRAGASAIFGLRREPASRHPVSGEPPG